MFMRGTQQEEKVTETQLLPEGGGAWKSMGSHMEGVCLHDKRIVCRAALCVTMCVCVREREMVWSFLCQRLLQYISESMKV